MDTTITTTEVDYSARRRQVIGWLLAHPDRHDQSVWLDDVEGHQARMGVAGCAASYSAPVGTLWFDGELMLPDGEVWDIDDFAQEWLGLDDYEANDIFNSLHNREALVYLEASILRAA